MATSNSVIISKKSQKLTNEEMGSVDRISNLPDSVLLHILSFLPTKYAVATGLLSKRWELLWTDVPSLDFEDKEENSESKNFSNFVNHTLLHHNAKSIHKFSVKCGSRTDEYDVQSWVFMAISRNAQELNVSLRRFHGSQSFYLPRCVFNCSTLVSLKLCGRFRIPSSVCIPNLKTLNLDSVIYSDDESVSKLISCCSVLENLSVRRQRFDNVNIFHISAPALKRLSVDFHFPIDNEFLLQPHVLEINAPALEYLYTRDHLSRQLVDANFGSLIKADVVLGCYYSSYSESIIKCLEAFSNVKFLSLSGFAAFETLNWEPGLLSTKFLNLTHLYFTMWAGCFWFSLLLYFIESSDNLQVLKLKKCYVGRKNGDSGWIEPKHVPRCLLSCLRAISIEFFEQSEDEFAMLKYILKNGKVLEVVEIHHQALRKKDEFDVKFHIVQKILKFPRGSTACEIVFV